MDDNPALLTSENCFETGRWKVHVETLKVSIDPISRKILDLQCNSAPGLRRVLGTIDQDYRRRLIREFKLAIAGGVLIDLKLKLILKDGHARWIRIIGMIESGQKSLPTKVIGTLQDISQTVRQEYSRISLLNHELRNPLSVIKLNLQTVLNMLVAKSTNPVFRLLQNADSQTEYICALMDDYLHKNWEETGLCYLDLKRFDLDEMIDKVIVNARLLYPSYRFSKFSKGKLIVTADRPKIVRALNNYLSNAVKYSPKGSGISVILENHESFVQVCVEDNGIGIDLTEKNLLFEKYYRSPDDKIKAIPGHGLGLFLVKEIIMKHGGTVRAEKSKGKGSIFFFTLPQK